MTEIQHAGLHKSVSCSSLQPLQAWHNLMLSTDEIIDLQSAKSPGCFAHISSPHWLKKKRERENEIPVLHLHDLTVKQAEPGSMFAPQIVHSAQPTMVVFRFNRRIRYCKNLRIQTHYHMSSIWNPFL